MINDFINLCMQITKFYDIKVRLLITLTCTKIFCIKRDINYFMFFQISVTSVCFSLLILNLKQSKCNTQEAMSRLIRANRWSINMWSLTQFESKSSKGNCIYSNKNARSKKMCFPESIKDTLMKWYWLLHIKLDFIIGYTKNIECSFETLGHILKFRYFVSWFTFFY